MMDHATLQSIVSLPEIRITHRDLNRLQELLRAHAPIRSWKSVAFLVAEMDRATIIDDEQVDATLVTIGTRTRFCVDDRNETTVATLTLPGTRDLYPDAISVLTPVGVALIGLSVGQTMPYVGPDGRVRTISINTVLHQPQASRSGASRGAQVLRHFPVPTD